MRRFLPFRQSRGYALAVAASVALGVAGACTAFAVVKRAFVDPLPYPEAERLLTIRTVVDGEASFVSSYRFADELRSAAVFTALSADWGRTVTYEAPGASERLSAGAVTPNYFEVLGVPPALGHALTRGVDDEVVVSWGFAERALGGAATAVGQSIVIDGITRRVAGVMGREFVGPYLSEAQLWLPLDTRPFESDRARGSRGVILQARLADGVSLDEARAVLAVAGTRQRSQYPEAFAGQSWLIDPLRDVLLEPSRTVLIGIAAATALLLLIVFTNVGGLAAARATELRRAAAVRLALGASRRRLFFDRLAESLALAGIGTAAGAWLASLLIGWVVRYQQQFQLFLEDVPVATFDAPEVLFGIAVGLAAALVAAAIPHAIATSARADELLAGARTAGSTAVSRTRASLVIAQAAIAVVLLCSAGLLMRTVHGLTSTPLGFDAGQLATFSVTLPAARYDTDARRLQFETGLLERLQHVQGIDQATAVLRMPTTGGPDIDVTVPGEASGLRAVSFTVAPGFFDFLRTPLVAGRELATSDRVGTPGVVVVNELMARTVWPAGNAIGARARLTSPGGTPRDVTVVGIVQDLRQDGWGREVRPTVFESTWQRPLSPNRSFAIRTSRPLAALAADVRAAVHAADPLLAVTTIGTLDARLESQIAQPRFMRALLGVFAAIAAGLCAVGLFAVVSLAAHARRHEFAIRMALGGGGRAILRLVLLQSLRLGVLGGVAGLIASTWLTGLFGSMLHGVAADDPATLAAAVAVIVTIAVVAALPPALRAARIDPLAVLKAN